MLHTKDEAAGATSPAAYLVCLRFRSATSTKGFVQRGLDAASLMCGFHGASATAEACTDWSGLLPLGDTTSASALPTACLRAATDGSSLIAVAKTYAIAIPANIFRLFNALIPLLLVLFLTYSLWPVLSNRTTSRSSTASRSSCGSSLPSWHFLSRSPAARRQKKG